MANSSTLTGRSVVVTGGASGIGLALVQFFASHGCNVALLDISLEPATHVQSLLSSLRQQFPSVKFIFQKCDVSSWDEQAEAFGKVYKEVGSIDVVCANAGIVEAGKFLGVEEGEPKRPNLKTLDIDLNGTLYSIKLGVHYMRKNTSREKGLVICTSSNAGLYPFPMAPMYAVAKHGVVGAVRSFAKPLEAEGIRINALCPNCIATGLADDNLMSSMKLTPMSTLLNTVKEFCMDTSLTGVTAEVSGEKGTHRWPPEYVDEITKENMEMFVKLGYA
ncbi:putative short chain dehydrogenase/reductase [Hyaloscypha variabilis F]|uniref:Putative short chain dehydrogenase/reductase n=1 Tax=Hyaloscypha variabilis (strain UAMH 11265 / GT02V1 / F) TaxID=1149755 RepID=A0A2J6S732_HYAVF|nr:putative short chain dehydrogenase/reductase [Hyaloscypha variabilis F]